MVCGRYQAIVMMLLRTNWTASTCIFKSAMKCQTSLSLFTHLPQSVGRHSTPLYRKPHRTL